MENVLWGLTWQTPNDVVRDTVFDKVQNARCCTLSTLPATGREPGARFVDIMCCRDDGLMYFGVGTGKPCNEEIVNNPVVTLSGAFVQSRTAEPEQQTPVTFRVTGRVREAANPLAVAEYWARNPHALRLWERHPEHFVIYGLFQGEGELCQLWRDTAIYRVRFGFGGVAPRPFRYRIDQEHCTGCGVCAQHCTAGIITVRNGKAAIPSHRCFECGVCRSACTHGAVLRMEKEGV